MAGRLARRRARARAGLAGPGRQGDRGRDGDAEHAAERAQDAAGLGGGGEEGGEIRVGEEMLELRAEIGGGLDVAQQPGAAGRAPGPHLFKK